MAPHPKCGSIIEISNRYTHTSEDTTPGLRVRSKWLKRAGKEEKHKVFIVVGSEVGSACDLRFPPVSKKGAPEFS